MGLPVPWNHFEAALLSLQDFDLGAQKLADFFKGKEERHGPDELLELFFKSNPPQKILERLLFFFLDIGVPDRQIGTRALQVRRLKRLWMRANARIPLTETEMDLTKRTEWMFDREASKVERDLAECRQVFARLIGGEAITDQERKSLVGLIGCEAHALRARVNWLSENTDPYNIKTMARILPRLRIYDEAVQEGVDLAQRQENKEPVGLKILSFEAYMKDSAFEKWLKKISKGSEALKSLVRLIEMQREKKIPTLDLIALSTLCRWTWEAKGEKAGPIEWISKAMDSYHEGEFSVEVGDAGRILLPGLSQSGATIIGKSITGNFGLKSFPAWVGRDLLTKAFLKGMDEGGLDMKAVITQNITRDSILENLLNNPKVFQNPGLVEYIASTSRSLVILCRIAKTRQLTNGFANRDVPLALLNSPCNIPISLLRPFINVRYVALLELKNIARAKAGVRREVSAECELYLKTRG
jgi:hypothetical protein